MFKLMGCLVLMGCCGLLGYIKASAYRNRCMELENTIELIKLMDMELAYKKDPLAKSFNKISGVKKSWFSSVLKACSTNLHNNYTLENAWKDAINEYRNKAPLKDKDINILNDFFIGIGKTDAEGQRKIFEPAIYRLKSNLKDAYDQEHKLGKMYIALGTAAGAVAVILLI